MKSENLKIQAQTLLAPADIKINGSNPWDIQVHNPNFYQRVFTKGSLGLGESYMEGWWDCQALDQFFDRLLLADVTSKVKIPLPVMLGLAKERLFNLQAISRAFEVGKKHYDLGNDFFEAMLGKSMAYSCGYWKEAQDLDSAQFAKFDLICKKLNLQKGQKILDIGSGWGSFAKYAAENYGVSVVGVTVSKEQLMFAQEACKGLPVEFRLQDYRALGEPFDHIVSVGMFEHVGVKNYTTYMQVVRRCLKKDGLFLLHTIGSKQSSYGTDPWLGKYIFPNSMLPSLAQIAKSCEKNFVIEDVHNFGANYDKTLMAWHQNFQTHWSRSQSDTGSRINLISSNLSGAEFSGYKSAPGSAQKYGPTFYRMWEYYLLSCAGLFRSRDIQLWQIVLSANGVRGGYKSMR